MSSENNNGQNNSGENNRGQNNNNSESDWDSEAEGAWISFIIDKLRELSSSSAQLVMQTYTMMTRFDLPTETMTNEVVRFLQEAHQKTAQIDRDVAEFLSQSSERYRPRNQASAMPPDDDVQIIEDDSSGDVQVISDDSDTRQSDVQIIEDDSEPMAEDNSDNLNTVEKSAGSGDPNNVSPMETEDVPNTINRIEESAGNTSIADLLAVADEVISDALKNLKEVAESYDPVDLSFKAYEEGVSSTPNRIQKSAENGDPEDLVVMADDISSALDMMEEPAGNGNPEGSTTF